MATTETTSVGPGTDDSDKIDRAVWRISFIVVIGSIMSILDTTIVNVAINTLHRELHSSLASVQWVSTGYMLSLAAVIPVTGWAAARFGAKRVYLFTLVLFTLGSALCGLATSTGELIAFRVIQGLGGGMILPIGQLIMAQAAGPKRMGRVMSVISVPAMLAPILGPTLGGAILQNMSWSWIFYVNVPIGAIAVITAVRMLPSPERLPAPRLDVIGLVLMASGLPLLTYAFAEIGIIGSFSLTHVGIPLVLSLVLLAAFARHALRVPAPLLDLRLMRRPTFASASGATFFLAAALFGAMILLPLYWQNVRHESIIDTGLLIAPQGLGAAAVMPLSGRLTDRYGGGVLALFGVSLVTLATIPFGLVGAHTSILELSIVNVFRGIGIGFGFMPAMSAAFASLERHELGHATPQLNVLQRTGGSIGTAVLAVVLQRALIGHHTLAGQASAFGVAFWASSALSALAIIPCLFLMRTERRAKAAKAASALAPGAISPEVVAA
jgi:EmrB/QacA subfamily drug resistance transporter